MQHHLIWYTGNSKSIRVVRSAAEQEAPGDPFRKSGQNCPRHRDLDLPEEIAHQLGWIVPPSILEIEETHAARVVTQRIVEAEVRGRQDSFRHVRSSSSFRDPPSRALLADLRPNRSSSDGGVRRARNSAPRRPAPIPARFFQFAQPPVHARQVLADAETRFSGQRQCGGLRLRARVLQLPAETQRLPDQRPGRSPAKRSPGR
jgi:hypothetical protein